MENFKDIYKLEIAEIYEALETSEEGLSEEEAVKRLEIYGENKIAQGKKNHFRNFLKSIWRFDDLDVDCSRNNFRFLGE